MKRTLHPTGMTIPLCYFIRHGRTAWNAEARLQGQADTELDETGKRQAQENGLLLARHIGDGSGFDFVASPLARTRATMELMREAMGLEPTAYKVDPRLVEVHFGDWQGFTIAELEARQAGCTAGRAADKWNFCPPGAGAESYRMLQARIRPWLESLARPTVCVTHGGVIRTLFVLTGQMGEREAAALDVPQDRILRLKGQRLDWL